MHSASGANRQIRCQIATHSDPRESRPTHLEYMTCEATAARGQASGPLPTFVSNKPDNPIGCCGVHSLSEAGKFPDSFKQAHKTPTAK